MRILSILSLGVLLTAGPALAATSAGFGATNTHCYTSTVLDSITYPQVGWLDLPVHECALTTSGTVNVLGCDAAACQVSATATFTGTWNVPNYAYIQSAVARDYYNGSAICGYATGDLLQGALPTTGGSCTGTAAGVPVFVVPGACKPVYVLASLQMYVITSEVPTIGYVALTYTWSRIDTEFNLCRSATGTPSIVHVRDYLY